MINKILSTALTLSLGAVPAFAGSLSLKLGDIKTLRGSGVSPDRISNATLVPSFKSAPAQIVPVDYKREPGPGVVDPNGPPPNLKKEHFIQLSKGVEGIESEAIGEQALQQIGSSLTPHELQRLLNRMVQLDKMAVDPIAGSKWTTIIDKMIATGKKNFKPAEANWPAVVDLMIKEAYAGLKDPFSQFMNPLESARMVKGMSGGGYSGIGAQLKPHAKGIELDLVFPKSPAEKAKLQEGDVITHVNGVSMEGKDVGEVVKRIVGKAGSKVTLTIERAGSAKDVDVIRGNIARPNVYSENLGNGIGYVYWGQFSDSSETEVLDAVDALKGQGVTKVILDVRGNPGGRVDAVAEIASEFLLDKQQILTFRRQGKISSNFVTDGDGQFKDMQVAVLVNGSSYSASEILALTFKDHKRGAIVGSTTGGKGTAQSVMLGQQETLMRTPQGIAQMITPTGRIGKVTSERWHGPGGGSIDGDRDPGNGSIVPGTGGVVPTVAVTVTEDEERAVMKQIMRKMYGAKIKSPVQDKVLEKAVEIIGRDAS
jgi:C-terminal peptidase prc